METNTFIIPDLTNPTFITEKSEEVADENLQSKSKEPKKLAKVNRPINCIFCESERILNPKQYQSYFDYWGDEEKIKRNFVCKPCEMLQNENPFSFWLKNHDSVKKVVRALKAVFEVYKGSSKAQEDVVTLQNMTNNVLKDVHVDITKIEFLLENRLPVAVRVKNMPFVGDFEIRPYDEIKIKI